MAEEKETAVVIEEKDDAKALENQENLEMEAIDLDAEEDDFKILEELIRKRQEEVRAIIEEVQAKHPGVKLYYTDIPHEGLFVFRKQNLADVKESDKAAHQYMDKKIQEQGGLQEVEKKDKEAQRVFFRDIDNEAADISNIKTLSRCVLYPFDFPDTVSSLRIGAGTAAMLLERIMEVSGWVQAQVLEV